ncbi:PfkB family carbohydrate kinase [Serinicoccus sediminis]|uniref:PfkB family carbohydrate kinase n=1 Tax=Serinicoccus sediminis TaxID=2306021 RepID=UPI0010217C17|nr:PfkB family carbohydrate kinase [Serinicoccus sediminis]
MTTPARRVIHTGQAMVDLVLEVGTLPVRGGNVMADSATRYAGGAVTIVVAAARSGAPAVLAGAVGTGPNGDLVREVLAAEGVEASAPAVEDLDTGECVVLVEPSAERTFVTTRAAERRITPESLATSAPAGGDLVCVSGYTLLPPTRDPLLGWLEGLPEGVEVVLDPGAPFAGFAPAVVERVLARTTVWTSNAAEALDLVGGPAAGEPDRAEAPGGEEGAVTGADLVALAEGVAARLAPGAVVVVRDGPRGCVVLAEGESVTVPGFPQTPVDTNGAGDTHTGVLCAGVATGMPFPEAARRANAGAAVKVTRRGPATAPTAAEVDAFLEERG